MKIVITDEDSHTSDYYEEMQKYIDCYGKHFNKKLCDYAIKNMLTAHSSTGELINLEPISKDTIDSKLKEYSITLNNNKHYDYVYVANMCKADYHGSSIIDDYHLYLFVKDYIDDCDGYEGIAFSRWYADIKGKGIELDWTEFM